LTFTPLNTVRLLKAPLNLVNHLATPLESQLPLQLIGHLPRLSEIYYPSSLNLMEGLRLKVEVVLDHSVVGLLHHPYNTLTRVGVPCLDMPPWHRWRLNDLNLGNSEKDLIDMIRLQKQIDDTRPPLDHLVDENTLLKLRIEIEKNGKGRGMLILVVLLLGFRIDHLTRICVIVLRMIIENLLEMLKDGMVRIQGDTLPDRMSEIGVILHRIVMVSEMDIVIHP